ncbi:MAG TPA: alpha/beta hydrolase [Sphingomonas sp.]|nr:alpha/beta hydrolase [Sphingomonas sp.]
MAEYEDRYWQSADGLKLHVRDYPGDPSRPPILCIPGLTRNARDFEELADRLAGDWRVLAVDLRGRGESAYARDPASYTPLTYADDLLALLDELALPRVAAFGTSLGGIVTMLIAARAGDRLAGVLLNDVGPEIELAGLARIRSYVGKPGSFPTWMHAARALADGNAEIYPHYAVDDWLAMAKRLYRINGAGRIVLDYDMKIAEPFREPGGEAAPDMWPAFAALDGVPALIVRGGLSDVLSAETADRMAASLAHAELVTVPGVGHAPLLTEPECAAAIDRLLARIAKEPATV